MSERHCSGGCSLGAFVIGAILGAAAGILLAPEKGEVTREKIKDWAEDKWDESKENLEELKEEIEEKIAKKKKILGKKLAQMKDKIAEAVVDDEEK